MAKKTCSLVEAAKALPIRRSAFGFRRSLKPAQLEEYNAFLEWLRSGTPGLDRPILADAYELVIERYGGGLSLRSFRAHVSGE